MIDDEFHTDLPIPGKTGETQPSLNQGGYRPSVTILAVLGGYLPELLGEGICIHTRYLLI